MRRIADGDMAAYGELYERYADELLSVAVRILVDRMEAQDLIHDVFMTVQERAGQFDPARGAAAPWLFAMVRNRSFTRVRQRARQRALARGASHEHAPGAADGAAAQDDIAERSGDKGRVLATLPLLSPLQRAVLEAAFFEGLSYPEIAARADVPLGTIKSRVARALAALRARLEERC
jgi:RNA polymerase sigma-70 factor (ECF subfamily)